MVFNAGQRESDRPKQHPLERRVGHRPRPGGVTFNDGNETPWPHSNKMPGRRLQNFPGLTSAVTAGGFTTVWGSEDDRKD